MKNTIPSHFEAQEREFYTSMVNEYSINDTGGLALLIAACDNHARARRCREIIDREGEMVGGKPHPLCAIERDSRKGFVAVIKALELDIETTTQSAGRPTTQAQAVRRVR